MTVLILGLKIDESIMVGDNVEVVFLSFRGGQLRLGFKAPKEITIHRKAVYRRIQAEKATP